MEKVKNLSDEESEKLLLRNGLLRKKYVQARLRGILEELDEITKTDSLVIKTNDLTINFKDENVTLEIAQYCYNEILSSENDVRKKALIMDAKKFINKCPLEKKEKNKLKRRAEKAIIDGFNSKENYETEFLLYSYPSNSSKNYNGFSTQRDETFFYVTRFGNEISIGYKTERKSGTGKNKLKNNKIIQSVKIK